MNFKKTSLLFLILTIQAQEYSKENLEKLKCNLEAQYNNLVQEENSEPNKKLRIIFFKSIENFLKEALNPNSGFIENPHANSYLNLLERYFISLMFRVKNGTDLYNQIHPLRPENFSRIIDFEETSVLWEELKDETKPNNNASKEKEEKITKKFNCLYYTPSNNSIPHFDILTEKLVDSFGIEGSIDFIPDEKIDLCTKMRKYLLEYILVQPDPQRPSSNIRFRLNALNLFVLATIKKLEDPKKRFFECGHHAAKEIDPKGENTLLKAIYSHFGFKLMQTEVPKGAMGASLEKEKSLNNCRKKKITII